MTSGVSGWRRAKAELRGQLGGTVGGIGDRVDLALAPLGREIGMAQQVDRTANDREEIVEVVRHPAGQLPDRLQLLRLTQLFLGLAQRFFGGPLLRNVPADREHLVAVRRADPDIHS